MTCLKTCFNSFLVMAPLNMIIVKQDYYRSYRQFSAILIYSNTILQKLTKNMDDLSKRFYC